MIKIALLGKQGVGKSVVAAELAKAHGLEIVTLASPLKQIATTILGREIIKKQDRAFLCELGAVIRAHIDINYFVKRVTEYVSFMSTQRQYGGGFVIDDLRFQNEVKMLKDEGFITIRLKVSDETRYDRLEARDGVNMVQCVSADKDLSENDLNDYVADFCITGEGLTPVEIADIIESLVKGVAECRTY